MSSRPVGGGPVGRVWAHLVSDASLDTTVWGWIQILIGVVAVGTGLARKTVRSARWPT